jgi:predicted dehydrogenase
MDLDRRNLTLGLAAALVAPKARAANDRPTYGLVAAGGRGRYLNRSFQKLGAQCVALCDVYEPNLEAAKKEAPADVKTYVDYKDLLAQTGVDFVVLAGPDHWHCPMLLDSLKAGKDVYAEKPLSKTLEESQIMIDAVKKSTKIVQVGMQRRSAESIKNAKKIADDGRLGRVTMVKAQWNWNVAGPLNNSPLPGKLDWDRFLGKAKKRPLEPMRFRYWRQFWDYSGGNMTDQGTHLMDVVQWFTNSGAPRSAICNGYVAKNTGAEAPDVFSAVFDNGEFMTTWTLDYSNAYENGWSILFMGDKGTLRLDEEGYKFWEEPWFKQPAPTVVEKSPVPIETHIQNFLDCIKSRQQPNCTVEIAAAAVAGPHLANLAFFKGKLMKLGADLVKVS